MWVRPDNGAHSGLRRVGCCMSVERQVQRKQFKRRKIVTSGWWPNKTWLLAECGSLVVRLHPQIYRLASYFSTSNTIYLNLRSPNCRHSPLIFHFVGWGHQPPTSLSHLPSFTPKRSSLCSYFDIVETVNVCTGIHVARLRLIRCYFSITSQ